MQTEIVKADETMDQEALGRLFARHDLIAIPVVDAEGRMKGIVTVDDIVDVVQEEATEDIQKIGGTEALDGPVPPDAVLVGWCASARAGSRSCSSARRSPPPPWATSRTR